MGANSPPPPLPPQIDSSSLSLSLSQDETTAKALNKRYEGLMMVRTKALNGKGAWYWSHLVPLLVHDKETVKSVKLKCCLCGSVFSASNPSRTASEHLKKGTCPNFTSIVKPISSISTSVAAAAVTVTVKEDSNSPIQRNHRKKAKLSSVAAAATTSGGGGGVSGFLSNDYQAITPSRSVDQSTLLSQMPYAKVVSPLTCGGLSLSGGGGAAVGSGVSLVSWGSLSGAGAGGGVTVVNQNQNQNQNQNMILSGGKEDLDALAMLEDSVKKLKSLKTSPGPMLSAAKIGGAFDLLAEWLYQSCSSVSFSSLNHPKFKAFLNQVGLPEINLKQFTGSKLDSRYEEAKSESEERIRDAMFFQISSNGWNNKFKCDNLVNFMVNLPNGTSIFHKALFLTSSVPSGYAEDVLCEAITSICGSVSQRCVGIVSDKFKSKALRKLESEHQWMVNLYCQFHGFNKLIKDFGKDLPLLNDVTKNCLKLSNFVLNNPQIRNTFAKYQLQESGESKLIRIPLKACNELNYEPVLTMFEDILNSSRAIQLVLLDESYKIVSMEDRVAREVADMIRSFGFWNELEAAHSLINLVKHMAQQIETERPLVGQCLPLWDELRSKVKEWCSKFSINDMLAIEKLIQRRFKKNYHPAWAAAFILDPVYLIKDTSGKYLPPFKCLTAEEEKDVDKLITRLVSREEAHIALMELMKWRSEGLDPVYARAVQMKERDPITGKMKFANPQSSRLVWETYLTEFKALGKVAVRLIFLRATSCGFKCNLSKFKWVFNIQHRHSRAGIEKAQKLIFIAAHSKLERRDFSCDDDDDDTNAELFALANGDDNDDHNEVFIDASSV